MVGDNNNNHGGSPRSIPLRSFASRLYEMVGDPSTDSIISWSESGNSFIVWNQSELCRDVLPRYAQGNLLSNFTSKLSNYGFRKVEQERFEYAHDNFVRGKPELAEEILKPYLARLIPEFLAALRASESARIKEGIKALRMATKERALTNNLSNLTL